LTKCSTLALTLLLLFGCAPAPPESDATPDPAAVETPAEPPKPVPAELPDPVARVNGEAIDRAEFEKAIQAIERQAGGPVPPERRDEIFRGVLDQMIAVRLLVQESALREIAVSDAEIDARYAELLQQFPTEEAFAEALATEGVTTARLRADVRTDLAVNRLLDREVESKVSASDLDARAFYDQNLEQFQEDEAVRASHILVRVAPDAGDQARQAARATAEDLLRQLRAGGDFAELAREYSQDASAAQGGDLDFFTRGQMLPDFATAAFALQKDQLSDIVETQFGLHLIKVTDRRAPRTVPFAEVDAQIREFLEGQQREEATIAFVEALKRKGQVEILF
jgi:peptidyl-prolyl cis-trans isomerase C